MRDEHVALDIVQDSMTKLIEKYAAKPPEELPLLFQRILQNTIRDFYRRQKTRSLWTTLFSSFTSKQEKDDDEYDFLETLRVKAKSNFDDPMDNLQNIFYRQVLGVSFENKQLSLFHTICLFNFTRIQSHSFM